MNDRLYEVTKFLFFHMTIEAVQTNLTVGDVCEDEIWGMAEFRNYKVKLINGDGGMGEIVDFEEFKNRNRQ